MFNPYPKPDAKPKKEPKPLKRTPLKKKPYTLRKFTPKQKSNLQKYEVGKREKYGESPNVCTGCGRNDVGISCSHLVARSHSFELVSEKLNHEMQCFKCAEATESGRFFELKNGLQLLERLWGSLGEAGKHRFRYVINQWPQNQDLWQYSAMIDEPCDD